MKPQTDTQNWLKPPNRQTIIDPLLMLYFRSRPRGMKYAFEMMRFITCVKALYTQTIGLYMDSLLTGEVVKGRMVLMTLNKSTLLKATKLF